METIAHTVHFESNPAKAYEAVGTAAGVKGWWCKNSDIAAEVGGKMVLKFDKQGTEVVMTFRIDTLDDEKKVVWTCTDNDNPTWIGTKLTFDFAAAKGGTELSFTHDGWKQGGEGYEMTKGGWPHFMSSLKSFVDTGKGEPW